MKVKLSTGAIVRVMWAVFDPEKNTQLVRWDMRRDKVVSTARRLARSGYKGALQLRSQKFITPPQEELTPEATDAPRATPPGSGPDSDAAVAQADHQGTQSIGGAPEPAVGAEAPAATSLS